MIGATVQFLSDTAKLVIGNTLKTVSGEKANWGVDAVNYLRKYMPGKNIWYLRLALQRMIFDQLANEIDPAVERKRRALEKSMDKEYKQDYWWKPGTTSPQKLPDLPEAFRT